MCIRDRLGVFGYYGDGSQDAYVYSEGNFSADDKVVIHAFHRYTLQSSDSFCNVASAGSDLKVTGINAAGGRTDVEVTLLYFP